MDRLYFQGAGLAVVLIMLAGCGGSQPPIGAPGAMPLTSTLAAPADRGKSWMLPEAKAEDLLYVSNYRGNYVAVYDYKTGTAVGSLSGFDGRGQCVTRTETCG